MAKKNRDQGAFLIQISNTQNATWQGVINWLQANKQQPFRSSLELIKLMDNAMGALFSEAEWSEEKRNN